MARRADSDAAAASGLTPAQQVRLELVTLVYRHDRSPTDAVARAEELERYVIGRQAPAKRGGDRQVEPEDPI